MAGNVIEQHAKDEFEIALSAAPLPLVGVLRRKLNMTQEQLTVAAGVNPTLVSKIENGEISIHNIAIKNGLALAKALNVSIEDLLPNKLL